MKSVKAACEFLIIFAGLIGCAAADAAEQQASFAVAITLHTMSRPMTVASLCPEGKPLDRVGVSITVTCPAEGETATASERAAIQRTSGAAKSPTVFVTF